MTIADGLSDEGRQQAELLEETVRELQARDRKSTRLNSSH